MSRRVVIGKKNDGTFGLRVSLPGVDALLADSSLGGFSFDDGWSDIAKVALTGTATNTGAGGGVPVVVPHGLGYVPFLEARLLTGSIIYDDIFALSNAFASNNYSGAPCHVTTSSFSLISQASGPLSGGVQPFVTYTVLYIVYQIPVPNPS